MARELNRPSYTYARYEFNAILTAIPSGRRLPELANLSASRRQREAAHSERSEIERRFISACTRRKL